MIARSLVFLVLLTVGGETEAELNPVSAECAWDQDADGVLSGFERYQAGDQLCFEDDAANLVIGQCESDGVIKVVETCDLLTSQRAYGCSSASVRGVQKARCDFGLVGL